MMIVTMTGEPFKRYVVDSADEHLFDNFEPGERGFFFFGAQALRSRGVIDEQYRSLSSNNVTGFTYRNRV